MQCVIEEQFCASLDGQKVCNKPIVRYRDQTFCRAPVELIDTRPAKLASVLFISFPFLHTNTIYIAKPILAKEREKANFNDNATHLMASCITENLRLA